MDNLPSASGWYRDSRCYANRAMSLKAEQMGMVPPADTQFTLRGTRVHEGNPESQDEKDALQFTESALLSAFREEVPDLREDQIVKEHRLYLRDGLVPYFTGQPDRYVVTDDKIIVGDLKPGFEADWEAWFYQINTYLTLLDVNYPGRTSFVGIIQTRFHGSKKWTWTIGEVTSPELIRTILQEDGPPEPGPWCRYCKARLICDAAITYGGLMEDNQPPIELSPRGLLGSEVITKLKLFVKLANDRLKWYVEQIKANPEFAPGWELATKKMPVIVDVQEAAKALMDSKLIDRGDMWKAVSISLPKLRESIAANNADVTLLKAKQIVDDLLGNLVRYQESEPFLVKSKEGAKIMSLSHFERPEDK